MKPEFDFKNYNKFMQPLSEEFIVRHADRLDWYYISMYQKLSESFIERHCEFVNWHSISECQKLSEEFIERNADRVDWGCICKYQKLSEKFIERHADRVAWGCISCRQKLSEAFIERYADRVNWDYISASQKLSEEFIERNADRVVWGYIGKYQKLSREFRIKHNLNQPENNWLYVDKETKRKAIENCNLYELDGDYVIAYKGIRSDGYSKYNFQYHYELGGIYEAHADHNLDEDDSFGLSAWTEEQARLYCNEKLIKVKIHLDDVAALVHDYGKIRCTRLEVIEEL